MEKSNEDELSFTVNGSNELPAMQESAEQNDNSKYAGEILIEIQNVTNNGDVQVTDSDEELSREDDIQELNNELREEQVAENTHDELQMQNDDEFSAQDHQFDNCEGEPTYCEDDVQVVDRCDDGNVDAAEEFAPECAGQENMLEEAAQTDLIEHETDEMFAAEGGNWENNENVDQDENFDQDENVDRDENVDQDETGDQDENVDQMDVVDKEGYSHNLATVDEVSTVVLHVNIVIALLYIKFL